MTEPLEVPGLLAGARNLDRRRNGTRAASRRVSSSGHEVLTGSGGETPGPPASTAGTGRGTGTATSRDGSPVTTFEAVFASEYPAVARMAYLLLGRTGEAEEAAQEAFTTLPQRWDRIDNPAGFVRTATLNRCRDVGRRRTVRARVLRSVQPRGDDTEPDYLLDALQQLEPKLRELIVLRYYLGHTVPEIADLVATPPGTVKSRLHRALAQLAVEVTEP